MSTPTHDPDPPTDRPISRRTVLIATVAVLSMLGGAIGYAVFIRTPPTPPRPPNVVVLVLDDLDTWTWDRLPQLRDLLVGREYTNAFVTNSMCCPSRMSMLTGLYPHNHGVLANEPPDGGFAAAAANGIQDQTVAVALQAAGYRTGLVGKYLNGYGDPAINALVDLPETYVPPGWDSWNATVGRLAYENFTVNENGKLVHPGNYILHWEADRAVQFMKARPDQPYFLWLAPIAPHDPAHPAPQDRYAKVTVELPPGEADRSDKPAFLQAERLTRSKAQLRGYQKHRLQTMLSATTLVQRVLTAMDENTYLILVSDNGLRLGQLGLPIGKATAYEPDIHVPLVIMGPDVVAGTDDRVALNLDIAPTVAALAGVELPVEADGVSLLADPAVTRDAFLVEHADLADIPAYAALRTADDRLYVEWSTGDVELYHMATDPLQDVNLAAGDGAAAYAAEISDLAARLHALQACSGASCR